VYKHAAPVAFQSVYCNYKIQTFFKSRGETLPGSVYRLRLSATYVN